MKKAPPNTATVSFHVTNCDARSAAFISGIVSLFCDPHCAKIVHEIRQGTLAIDMDPSDGQPCVFDPRQKRAPRSQYMPVTTQLSDSFTPTINNRN